MRATWAARRPRVWPSASTTYQVRLMSCGRGENVRWRATGMRANSVTGGEASGGRVHAYAARPARADGQGYRASPHTATDQGQSDRDAEAPGAGKASARG